MQENTYTCSTFVERNESFSGSLPENRKKYITMQIQINGNIYT